MVMLKINMQISLIVNCINFVKGVSLASHNYLLSIHHSGRDSQFMCENYPGTACRLYRSLTRHSNFVEVKPVIWNNERTQFSFQFMRRHRPPGVMVTGASDRWTVSYRVASFYSTLFGIKMEREVLSILNAT